MTQTRIIGDSAPREVVCPRCREDAVGRYLDEDRKRLEVICPDCGVFELPVQEFEQAEADVTGVPEP